MPQSATFDRPPSCRNPLSPSNFQKAKNWDPAVERSLFPRAVRKTPEQLPRHLRLQRWLYSVFNLAWNSSIFLLGLLLVRILLFSRILRGYQYQNIGTVTCNICKYQIQRQSTALPISNHGQSAALQCVAFGREIGFRPLEMRFRQAYPVQNCRKF